MGFIGVNEGLYFTGKSALPQKVIRDALWVLASVCSYP